MSETNDTQDEEQKEYTPEEIKAMRAKTIKFYKEEITLLKVEEQYHDLKAKIEEAKTRELVAISQFAQIMNPVRQQQQPQPEIGEDGFPVEWDEEQKAEFLKQNPDYQKEIDRWKDAKAKAAAEAEEKEEEEPVQKPKSGKKRELAKDK